MARLKRGLRRAVIAVIGLFALGWLAAGVFLLSFFASDLRIAWSWHSATATIEALGEPRSARNGPYFPAVLRVRRADGSVLVAHAARDLPMPPREYWFGPIRNPAVGDRVEVHVAPVGAPGSIVPADRLTGWGFAAFVLLVWVVTPLVLLWHMPQMWRAASEVVPAMPDDAGRAADPARAKRAKASRRRRR